MSAHEFRYTPNQEKGLQSKVNNSGIPKGGEPLKDGETYIEFLLGRKPKG